MRRMYFAAIIIYNARRIGQPSYLAELFNTRRRIDFGRVTRSLSSKYHHALRVQAWNRLYMNAHNSEITCPTVYAIFFPWESSKLHFLNTFSTLIPNNLLFSTRFTSNIYLNLNFILKFLFFRPCPLLSWLLLIRILQHIRRPKTLTSEL